MLRTALLIVAAVVCAGGLLGCLAGHPAALPAALWGGLLLAAILVERWRYRLAPPRPGAPRRGLGRDRRALRRSRDGADAPGVVRAADRRAQVS